MNIVDRIMRLIFSSEFSNALVPQKRKMLAEVLESFINKNKKGK